MIFNLFIPFICIAVFKMFYKQGLKCDSCAAELFCLAEEWPKKNSNKLFSYWNGALILKAPKRYKKQITSAQSKCAKGHCMTGHRSFHTKKGHIHKSSWGGNTDDMFPKCHHTILHPVLSLGGHFLSLMRGLKNGQEAFSPRTSKE